MSRSFPLAPMSPVIRGLTIFVLALPLVFVALALFGHQGIGIVVFLFLVLLYGAVWLGCRPSSFVVSPDHVDLVFPVWHRRIPIESISGVRMMSSQRFQQEFGWAVRIGVGGLWGGFGWLWTQRRGMVEFYISKGDDFVLIERSTGGPLLITPETPESMVELIEEVMAV